MLISSFFSAFVCESRVVRMHEANGLAIVAVICADGTTSTVQPVKCFKRLAF